jgi:D-aspartate ligase
MVVRDISSEWIEGNSVPVVVLVSSQHGGLGLIRSLGRQGIAVYGVHQNSFEPAAWSRFLRGVSCWNFSQESTADSLLFLLNLAKRIGTKPILIATSDVTALFVAENAETLREKFLIATPPVEAVRIFSSKKLTAELCKKLGIPSPQTALPNSREEVLTFIDSTNLPIIVKGECGEFLRRRGHGARVAIVKSKQELLDIYDLNGEISIPKLIFQEYIPGGDDAIWMFNGYFNARSECLFSATGKKLRQFPAHRGSTSLGLCARNDAVEAQTMQLMQSVAYEGPVDMGYRFDARDGQYKLLDVNPRVGATFRLFTALNQLDVVRALYLDLTKQNVPPSQVPEGRKWIVENNDLLSSWTYFREGQLKPGAWIRSLRGIQECVWFTLDDLAPMFLLPYLWLRKRLLPMQNKMDHESETLQTGTKSETQ